MVIGQERNMDPIKKEIWFPAKRYGWGWGLPICWQGWIVLIVWMVLLSAGGSIPIFIPGYLGFEIYAAYVCVCSA